MNKRLGSKLDMFRTTRDLRANPAYTAALASVIGIANGFTALEGKGTDRLLTYRSIDNRED